MNIRPKLYGDANIKKRPSYFEFDTLDVQYGQLDNYEIVRKIGRGKYAEVFEGVQVQTLQKVVIKALKPIRSKKIKREIKILQNLNGQNNVIKLLDIVFDPASKTTSLIFEYISNLDYRVLYPQLTDQDTRFYLFEILKGLDFSHSMGIIHRDIKPHNIMIDNDKKQVKIIDWGLAEFYFPNKNYNVRVASRYFKSPELLLDYQYYDYSLDMWSFGALMAGIIFQQEPFFHGQDNYDQLDKIAKVLGTEDLQQYINKYRLVLSSNYENVLGQHNKRPLQKFINEENEHLAKPDAIDLLQGLLVYDHNERLTAKDAMQHPYFLNVRKSLKKQ
ncbi:Homeobox protein HD-6 [Paramecium bursaria]